MEVFMGISQNSDVLIIGGGVIGLSIARELHKTGVRQITVVDRSNCGTESSWAAGGMLGPQAEADEFGEFYRFCSDSRDLYPAFAAELLDETGIDIELDQTGTLYLALDDDDAVALDHRLTIQRSAGLNIEYLSPADTRKAEPFVSPDVRGSLYFKDDWQVDNRKLLTALRRYAELNGIKVTENCTVENLIVENGKVVGVSTANGVIRANETVLAGGAWSSMIAAPEVDLGFAMTPIRGQMICYRTAKQLFGHVIYSRRGYLVPRHDGRILAGSTSEKVGFSKGTTDEGVAFLRMMAEEIAPSLSGLEPFDRWSGLRPMANDAFPVIERVKDLEGLIAATGHYRNGILLAPITANLVAQIIERKGSESVAATTS